MVGASAEVPGWNSPQCGKCFKINYKGNNIYVTAVDHAGTGFVLSKAAMDALTGGQATAIGRITTGAAYVQVAQSFCKM